MKPPIHYPGAPVRVGRSAMQQLDHSTRRPGIYKLMQERSITVEEAKALISNPNVVFKTKERPGCFGQRRSPQFEAEADCQSCPHNDKCKEQYRK